MSSSPPKIKVCHLASGDLWAGAEVQVTVLLSSLVELPDLEISAIVFNDGRLANELRNLGIKTCVICESRHHVMSIVRQLTDYFRQHTVDILHTHKPKENVLGALSSIYSGVGYRVRTIHGFPEPHVGFRAIKTRLHRVLDNAVNRWFVDRILGVSIDLTTQLMSKFGNQKVVCIQNAIDIDQIQTSCGVSERRKDLNANRGEFLIGAMGRLTLGKGFETFLQSARIVCHDRPNVKFIIVGDGPLRGSLELLAHEYGLHEKVLFLGHRSDSHDILQLMDVLVLPSLSEGIPMVLLEGLALARPVVASRVGGIPEVIEHGRTGLLVSPNDADELAHTCIALMDNLGWAQQLGAAGRIRIAQGFSAKMMADKVLKVYRTLISNGAGRRNSTLWDRTNHECSEDFDSEDST